MISVAVLGSTGSIGRQTLDVVRAHPDRFRVAALVCGSDARLLAEQAEEFRPSFVGVAASDNADALRSLSYKCDVVAGENAQELAAARSDVDVVVAAVVGLKGLKGVVAAINAGKRVALANKETLVACGEYVTSLARSKGVSILPVDSEHCAVHQCIGDNKRSAISRIILTASGGPFYGAKAHELDSVTPEQAIRHPNWSMGKKISVDSATMMNKGLEIIEARWLFGTDNIDYIIQPESIVHSMVEFKDGFVMAQIAPPDMKLPIKYALEYPDRTDSQLNQFDFSRQIRFLPPDETVFPAPAYARAALKTGKTAPAVLNAANEAAVDLFLRRKIRFTDIARLVEHTLNHEKISAYTDYREILDLHASIVARLTDGYGAILGC